MLMNCCQKGSVCPLDFSGAPALATDFRFLPLLFNFARQPIIASREIDLYGLDRRSRNDEPPPNEFGEFILSQV